MHQNQFRLGLRPRPCAGEAYSALPDPLAGFKGPTSKGREGRAEKGMREEGRGGKGGGARPVCLLVLTILAPGLSAQSVGP